MNDVFHIHICISNCLGPNILEGQVFEKLVGLSGTETSGDVHILCHMLMVEVGNLLPRLCLYNRVK